MSDAHEDQYDAVPGATPATEHAPVEPVEGSGDGYEPQYLGGSRKKKRGVSGCLAVIVALAVVLGGAYFVGNKGYHYLKDHLSSAEAMLRDRGRKGAARRAVVDQAAAVLILQHALDTERETGRPPGEIVTGDS